MAFTPIEGYSEKRTSTVFQDGETKQRAEFNYNLSNTDWTPISYDENRTTVLVQNGDIKQRATVVYNIGESSGGGTVSGLTSVSHGSTLTGNGTTTSPLDVSSTITGDINTLKNDVQTLDGDVTGLGEQVSDVQQDVNTLKTTVSGKQNALSETQLEAVNSGITAEHVASYNAYAGEITAVETTANKADSAAEVAQQTANLVGENLEGVVAKIPTAASASNQLVDENSMTTALAAKANAADLGTMASADASDYSTKTVADTLYAAKSLESTVSTLSNTVNGKANSATTLAGYGITDAYTSEEVDNKLSGKLDTTTATSTYATITSVSTKADADSVYTKSEVDTELNKKLDTTTASSTYATITTVNGKADKATTLVGYGITDAYTKTETNNLLDDKLDSDTAASTYATQSSLTSGLATKANASDVYTKSDVDSELDGKVNIAQGADNAGKVLGIDNSGNVIPTTIQVEESPNTGVAVLLYYDSTQASDHSHAYNGVSLTGYDLAGYEVYSNGYVRQWGQDSTAAGATLVTLPISYNAASTVSMSFFVSATEVAAEATGSISAIPVAANQFQVDKPSAICNWETTGYITL